jgi:UDP:flavonoid glycosyltransferase YjiC (YdhE family)
MNITILAFGTRGDVQPILALGNALANRGHRVCMVAGGDFGPWIEQHGIAAARSTVDIQSIMEGDAAREWVKHGNNPLVNMRVMRQLFLDHGRAMILDAWNACQGAELIISGMLSDVYAVSIAERVGAHSISAWLQPSMRATRSGAATFNAPLPGRYSRLNYFFAKLLIEPFLWNLCGDVANRFREGTLGLKVQTRKQNAAARANMLVLHGYSRYVVPHPEDWPPHLHTTGYWFLRETHAWEPPRELANFIAAGEPPICIGFGSMTGEDGDALAHLFVEAVQAARVRAILLSGWAGLGSAALPKNIFRIDAAPHEWLFPRMQAVVHHGGAGTTAASLRAGLPTVVVPHLADQTFWGKRVAALGAGPAPIPREKLTAARLASAIRTATTDTQMKQRAADLGTKIRGEDGTQRAIQVIEQYIPKI